MDVKGLSKHTFLCGKLVLTGSLAPLPQSPPSLVRELVQCVCLLYAYVYIASMYIYTCICMYIRTQIYVYDLPNQWNQPKRALTEVAGVEDPTTAILI